MRMHDVGRRIGPGKGALAVVVMIAAAGHMDLQAQRGRGGGPVSASAAAPIDLTGYWVAIVNEDWRWRMVTPPHGDYASVPLSADGRQVADGWDASTDGLCEAYGAAGLMRMPTRLHITWEGDATLKIDTDAGQQTRRLFFDASRTPEGEPSLQGHSLAEWLRPGGGGRGGARGAGPGSGPTAQAGSLRVVTTHLREGWLRRNGVPYSDATVLTEYFDRFAAPDGAEWLVVTTIVNDPRYLTREFVTSSHFRREPDGSAWRPTTCRMS
jgi:hypothetical protein